VIVVVKQVFARNANPKPKIKTKKTKTKPGIPQS
jgi:hypothetical protein